MAWLIGRRTFLVWRVVQLWTFFSIFVLEIIRASQYSLYPQYWLHPQAGIWVSEGISFIIIGYILAKFNQRWNTDQFKEDVILDWILFTTWILQVVLNTVPATVSVCDATPYNISTYNGRTGCRLFLGGAALSFFALFTAIVTLIFSITRWKNGQQQISSSSYGIRHKQKPYVVKKGLLDNGEPALFFYSKNSSINRVYEKNNPKLKNIFTKISSISPSPDCPISISIPEPELAATARHIKDIPDADINVDDEKGENENENDLKY